MAQPRTVSGQKKTETLEDRLKIAQQSLVTQMQKAGYSVQDSQEIVRLARSMVGINKKPQAPELDPITHRNITIEDLNKARDLLIEVIRNPAKLPALLKGTDILAPVQKTRPGSLISEYRPEPLSFSGPVRFMALPEEKKPVPVKTFVYEVSVGDRTFKIETNKPLPGAGGSTSNIERTRVGQLKDMLLNDDRSVLAITEGSGKPMKRDDFTALYMKAYSAMIRSENYDDISVSRPLPKRT
jgi:hypothetical protein